MGKYQHFIKRNPSIYKTSENGDIVINKQVSGALPFDVPKRFNNEFSAERVNRNITLEEVALRSKTSTSYISQIEKGGYGLSLIKFITICNALEVNENILEKFLFAGKKNEDFLYYKLQDGKNISQNILDYMKDKNNLVF